MKKLTTLLLALALMFSLSACGDDEQKTDGDNKTPDNQQEQENKDGEDNSEGNVDRPLVVASADFNGDFYAGWTNTSYDKSIRQLVWGFGLMTDTPEGKIIDSPLVEKKEVSEDLLTWTFTLKDGLTFSNGNPLTVKDVKFTYEFYMDTEALEEAGASSLLGQYVDTVEVNEEERTITFKLKKVMFTTDAAVFYETWILDSVGITDGAKAANQTVQQYVKANISAPVGYGPYKIDEYKPSEYVKLSAFEGYVGEAPKIKNLIVKVVPTETEMDQLLQGEVDVLTQQVESEKIEAAKENNLSYNNYFRNGGGTVVLHCDFGPFQLTEVRQAFAYVFNVPKVIDLYLGEYGIASKGPYSKNQWMMYDDDEMELMGTAAEGKFEQSLIDYNIMDADGNFDEEANIAKAIELLDAAAAKTDGEYAKLTGNATDGYMWDGEPMEIKIAYTNFWADTYNLAWNAEYIAKLPFKVSLYGMDWPVMSGHWFGESDQERQYHAFVGGKGYAIKSNPRQTYTGELIKEWGVASENDSRFVGGNTYTPEEWEQLMLDIENCDPVNGSDKYRELWREYVRTFNKEVPVIPVYSNDYHDIYTSDLENFTTAAFWPWARAVEHANWK